MLGIGFLRACHAHVFAEARRGQRESIMQWCSVDDRTATSLAQACWITWISVTITELRDMHASVDAPCHSKHQPAV